MDSPDEKDSSSKYPKISKSNNSLHSQSDRNKSREIHDEDDVNKRLSLGVLKNHSLPTVSNKKKYLPTMFRSRESLTNDKGEERRLKEEAKLQLSMKPSFLPTKTYLSDDVTIMAGWMKMRNSMKIWVNRWFVLRPGKLIYCRDEKDASREKCSGILRLADCTIKERHPTKDGYSFKIYHLRHYPIYHRYGLRGETLKLALIPVSSNYCIVQVGSNQQRLAWIKAINEQILYANDHQRLLTDEEEEDGEFDQVFSSPEPEKDKLNTIDSEIPSKELSDSLFFVKHETLHRNLMESLNSKQDGVIKKLQSKTSKQMEQWKKELDLRIMGMEKRILASISQNNTKQTVPKIQLSYLNFFVVLLFVLILGRFLPPWGA